jgi:triosephosphate isomerase
MRKKIVAGNWKMNCSRAEAKALLQAVKAGVSVYPTISVAIFPSYIHLQLAENQLVDSLIEWGGQNLYIGKSGAFTGEVSALMLVDYGCRYVLVGHSERRIIFNEDSFFVAQKFKTALQFGLQPILCVGETLEQREKGDTEAVIAEQLNTVIQVVDVEMLKQAVIAYEPVWAIGSGLTASPEQAQAAHTFIRQLLAKYSIDVARTVRILYGGSVKADNAAELFAMPDIDGVLVGGASLDAKSFLAICEAAS